jgi:hypothetical protein
MVFLYQDSVESVVGGRANCVGRKVGERNRSHPQIGKLLNYFGPDYRFKFPFRTAAGTDDASNVRVINFWAPPRANGQVLPVRWWKASARGRWHWVFPVGTVFGEVQYQQAPDQRWVVYEIRTRTRYLDGWIPNVFRPFARAEELAQAITAREPNWQSQPGVAAYVEHLRNANNLTPAQMVSEAFASVFPTIDGALDVLPALNQPELIYSLLRETPFQSVVGTIWKEGSGLETYAPGGAETFGIVPGRYKGGLLAVNEVSCNRCHNETGHWLADFEDDIVLYGEVWGEDRIFTWHLFKPHRFIFDTFDDSDSNSRMINDRMVRAGLLQEGRPQPSDMIYRQLPVPFGPRP